MFIISQLPSVAKTSDVNEVGEGSYYSLPTPFFFLQQDGADIQDTR